MKKKANKAEEVLVTFDGDLGIENASEIKKKLTDAFSKSDFITIKYGTVTYADVSFFQIIYSALKEAAKNKKKVHTLIHENPYLKNLIERLGLSKTKEFSVEE